jgi:hypothetical protein
MTEPADGRVILPFRTEAGEVFTIEETVYYVLRLFLHLNGVASLAAAQRQ